MSEIPDEAGQEVAERNVLGGDLEPCSTDPVTGFHRDGSCRCGPQDIGLHAVCAVMTPEFLAHQRSVGNDLVTAHPQWRFPGLVPGSFRDRILEYSDITIMSQPDTQSPKAADLLPI